MNRKELAKEVSDFVSTQIGDNDTEDIDLGDASAQVEEFIQELDAEDGDTDEEEPSEEPEKA
jgi:hypothetical protein